MDTRPHTLHPLYARAHTWSRACTNSIHTGTNADPHKDERQQNPANRINANAVRCTYAVMFGHQNTFAALSVCGCMENSLTWNKICIENRNTAMWLESWHTHACSHRRQSDTALLLFPKHNDQNVHLPKNINFINILSFCAWDVYFLQHFIWTGNY